MAMRVPEYSQQHRYESPQVPAARLKGMDVQTSADMFGAQSGRQLEKAGYLVQRGGGQLAHLVDDYNTTKAQDAARQMQQGFLDWQSEAQKKQGEAGMNTVTDYDSWAKTKRDELAKGMSDVQRGRFDSLANMQDARFRHWADGYGHQQGQAYHISTQKGRVSNNTDMLIKNIHEPALAEIAVDQLYAAGLRLSELSGNSRGSEAEQAIVRETVSSALTLAIHARIQSGETGLATTLMKQHEGDLGGTAMAQLGAELKRERKRQDAEWKAEQREARLDAAVRETDYMFTQFGSDLASGYEYIREKYGNDPKTRLELEAAFSRRVGMEEAAENKTRRIQMEQHKNAALDAIGKDNATPQSVSGIILKADPAIQPDLMRAARNKFPSQEVVVSDAEKLAEAKDGIFTGKYKDEKEFKRLFMPYISSNEMEKFTNDIRKNKDKASDSSLRASFNSMLREYDIESLANAADKKPAEFVRDAWNGFVSEAYENDFSTAQERRQYMQEYLRRVSLSKPGFWLGNKWPNTEEGPSFVLRPLRDEGYSEVEPPRPQSLPDEAKWDAEREGWVYGNKIVRASRVVTK